MHWVKYKWKHSSNVNNPPTLSVLGKKSIVLNYGNRKPTFVNSKLSKVLDFENITFEAYTTGDLGNIV